MPPAPKGGRKRRAEKAAKRRERFVRQYHSPGFVYFTHCQPCIVAQAGGSGCGSGMDACHERSKGAGGTAADVFPGCHVHHMQQEAVGSRTFERRHRVDLRWAAAAHWAKWQALGHAGQEMWQQLAADAGYRWPA